VRVKNKRKSGFKMNQLSGQKIGLSHMSVTCPSKEGVVNRTTITRHIDWYVQGT
jgi:hypothetical protein